MAIHNQITPTNPLRRCKMPQATTTYPQKALSVYLQRLDRQTGQFRQAWRPAPSFDEQTHPKNLKTSLTEH